MSRDEAKFDKADIDAGMSAATPIGTEPPIPMRDPVTPAGPSDLHDLPHAKTEIVASPPQEVKKKPKPPEIEIDAGTGRLMPKTVSELWRLADAYAFRDCLPAGVRSREQMFLILSTGSEIGLNVTMAIRCIFINPKSNRCTIYGDAVPGLIMRSGLCTAFNETFEGEGDTLRAICEVERKGVKGSAVATFSVEDANRAGLWGKSGPWTQYPRRMLQMRARAFACRDRFADVLGGLSLAEELDGMPGTSSEAGTLDEALTARIGGEA